MLQGNGIVVGMGDTGIDVNHCHFSDSNVPFAGFLTVRCCVTQLLHVWLPASA